MLDQSATGSRSDEGTYRLNGGKRPAGGTPRIGLALSGGGYRAAVYHAGVVHELELRGIYLRAISSVSGGSIIAAAVLHGMSPEEFTRLVAAGRFNLVRSLATPQYVGHLVWNKLVPWEPERIAVDQLHRVNLRDARLGVQAELLQKALGLSDPRYPTERSVEWILNTTDLAGKQLVGLHREGLFLVPIARSFSFFQTALLRPPEGSGPYEKAEWCARQRESVPNEVEYLVAASGAFPAAFEPFRFRVSQRQLHLVDGGLLDNSGVIMLQVAADLANRPSAPVADRYRVDAVIASDGSDLSETTIRRDKNRTHDRTMEGLTAAADAMYAFSGAPYQSTGNPLPVLALSPRRVYRKTAGAGFDGAEFERRIADLDPKDRTQLLTLLQEIVPRTGRERAQGQSTGLRAGRSPDKSTPQAQLLELLYTFEEAATLDSRLSEITCRNLFCLGRVMAILHARELNRMTETTGTSPGWNVFGIRH